MKLIYITLIIAAIATQDAKGLTLEGKEGVTLESKNGVKVRSFGDLKEFCPTPPTVINDHCKGSKEFAKEVFKQMEINEINVKQGDLKAQYQKLFAEGLELLECKVKKDNLVKFSLKVICYYEGIKQELANFAKNGTLENVKKFVIDKITEIEAYKDKKEADFILLKLFKNILDAINKPAGEQA